MEAEQKTGIWSAFSDFLQIELLRFGSDEKPIVLTIGLVLLLVVALFVTRIVLRIIKRIFTRNLDYDEKLRFSGVFNFVKYFVYILVTISVLSSSGIDITLLLTATAVLFIGLGLALREIFQDIIGGLFIITDKSVQAGDIIELDGQVCKVFDIKLRTTRAVTRDEKVIVIPNHKFVTDSITNFTQNYKNTRQNISVRVSMDADVEVVKSLLLECATNHNKVLKIPEPFVLFEDFGEFAFSFELHFFVADSFSAPRIKSDLRFAVQDTFRKYNIRFPYPQREVKIVGNEKA